jgi:hypothetical protein
MFVGYVVGSRSALREARLPTVSPVIIPSAIPATRSERLIFAYNPITGKTHTQAFGINQSYKIFTKEEVSEIQKNFAEPYFDYYNEEKVQAVAMIITKPGYSFTAI